MYAAISHNRSVLRNGVPKLPKVIHRREIMKKGGFTAGIIYIMVLLYGCDSQTQQFTETEIPLTEVEKTGLPVIYIETQNAQPILSKEKYINMNLRIVADNPEYCLEKTGFQDGIRGRGNTTWDYPKKPYRIKFNQKTSLFGLERAKSWVLLADYRSPTLLQNVIGFELGQRFGFPFTNHYQHIELVLNGEYQGTYILTEQVHVGSGRVAIDENEGFLVEFDFRYDEEPKFMTNLYRLPAMIKYPEDLDVSGYDFVKTAINDLEAAMRNVSFPDADTEN
jgi:hypothetical protein